MTISHRTIALAAGALLTLAGAAPGQITSHPDDVELIIPQRRVLVSPHHAPHVQMKSVDVTASLGEAVATTTMRITLTNTGSRQQEAKLLVPVPDGSVVRSFVLEGLGDEGQAQVLPRDEAVRIYTDIVRRVQDPGLLEFAGSGLVQSSVFPVAPGGEQSLVLTYERGLDVDGARVDYFLPRTASLEATGVAWTIGLDIDAARPISTVYSPSHDLAVERKAPDKVKVTVTPDSIRNDTGTVRISYLMEAADGVSASLMAYPDPEVASGADGMGGYFMLLAGLPAEAQKDRQVKREVILVIDRSGSMRGEKIEQAREAALQVIEGLDDGEAFNIVDYSDTIAVFAENPVTKNDETIAEARQYLAKLSPGGGTNIHDALLTALRQDPTEGALPMVLFLTDGLPTVGKRSEVDIREGAKGANIHGRRVFTFGVGVDVNAPLLTALARSSRATSAFVLPDEDVEVKVGSVFKRLSGPILAAPTLVALGDDGKPDPKQMREVLPTELPDLFEGDQLTVLGQYTSEEPLRLRLTGEYLGQQKSFEFTFHVKKLATTDSAYVGRLWAARKIGALLEEIRLAGANGPSYGQPAQPESPGMQELVEEVVRLSMKWGILTEYTAFLAVEPGAVEGEEVAGLRRLYANSDLVLGETMASVPADASPRAAAELAQTAVDARAQRERAGAGAVQQEINLGRLAEADKLETKNMLYAISGGGKQVQRVEFTTIQQANDKTMFKRGARWVDAALLEQAEAEPDEVVKFGTERFDALLMDLVKKNQQATLALGGEVYLLVEGKRVLVMWDEAGQ
ncbi:MAG: VWA domain-containing protein [Phycisphaerales bacterium JB039]